MTKREKEQRDWYRQRLVDTALLDRAVSLFVDRRTLLGIAVPVGGKRRGGYVSCATIDWAKQVYRQLENRPGFPHLRINYSPSTDACHVVEWGGLPSEKPNADRARGRFYGYRC